MRKGLLSCAMVTGALVCFSNASSAQMSEQAEAGHEIAERFCARCHAIGPDGDSPHKSAPPLPRAMSKSGRGAWRGHRRWPFRHDAVSIQPEKCRRARGLSEEPKRERIDVFQLFILIVLFTFVGAFVF